MVASAGSRSGRAPVLSKYDVLEELGHGGMATVYRGHDRRLSRDVAIKVLHPHLRESGEISHRFAVEAKAVAKLRHPNIVEVFDVSSEGESEQYLVVELVRGPTLRRVLQDHGALPPEIAAAIAMELLAGIAHAHAAGVVHRDVKPENVLVEHRAAGGRPARGEPGGPRSAPVGSEESPRPRREDRDASSKGERVGIKLTDFGIAKLLDAQGVTATGQVLGSPAHMAPEQIEGGDVDGRADVFGLGVLLYECMVGHLPFMGSNPAQVLRRVLDGLYPSAERERPTVGKTWSQILDRAMARQPEARYADASAMREAIAAELSRLGMGPPRAEIEAWFDDPEGWTDAHEKHLVQRLCELGAASRRSSAVVAAAADYNRALAYAPNDASLLKVVASMRRYESRARLVRRVTPIVLGAASLGAPAYFLLQAPRAELPAAVPVTGRPVVSVGAGSVKAPPAPLSADRPVSQAMTVSSAAPAPTRTLTTALAPPSIKPAQRTVTLTTLRPAFGVHMTIDGARAPDPDVHKPFLVDDKAHTLVFSCAEDLCVPKTVVITAGDKSETLSIELLIAPARLVVEGDPSHSYGIEELPGWTISAGQQTEVPMSAGNKLVTVFDRIDAKKQAVQLRAGKPVTVSFKTR